MKILEYKRFARSKTLNFDWLKEQGTHVWKILIGQNIHRFNTRKRLRLCLSQHGG